MCITVRLTNLLLRILDEFPNTYAFSKCLTEDLLYKYRKQLPISIVRPSIGTNYVIKISKKISK